jgi:hypothetical protein
MSALQFIRATDAEACPSPLLTNLNLLSNALPDTQNKSTASLVDQFRTAYIFFICHAKMITWVQFIAAFAIIFSGLTTNIADASLRGRDTSMQTPRRFECPTETPAIGSTCQSVEEDESPTCYFNFVKTPGPSPDISNFLPSISCSCRNVQWECDIAPEYLKALVEAASG